MAKPLWRWTCGNCLQQGLDILAESIRRTTDVFGIDNFDWVICYNGLNKSELNFLSDAIGDKPIQLVSQNWAMCPISDNCQSPRRRDGSFEWDGKRCGGTLWKVCPPRMRIDAHEIIVDNDIVFVKKLPQIEEWLSQNYKALILEEPIRFYGRYDCLFEPEIPCLNSGIMGLPPGYDFESAIYNSWVQFGRYLNITQADEQGLLTYTLSRLPSIRIDSDQVLELLHREHRSLVTGKEYAYHFTQANRMDNHPQWRKYLKMVDDERS